MTQPTNTTPTTRPSGSGAAARVFGIAELRDMILDHLDPPMASLASFSAINHDFHNSIYHDYRRRLFLEPLGPVLTPLQYIEPQLLHGGDGLHMRNPATDYKTVPAYLTTMDINPRFQFRIDSGWLPYPMDTTGTYQVVQLFPALLGTLPLAELILEDDPEEPESLASKHALNQFLTQPPITAIDRKTQSYGWIDVFGGPRQPWIYNPEGVKLEDIVDVLRSIWEDRTESLADWGASDEQVLANVREMMSRTCLTIMVPRSEGMRVLPLRN